MRDTIIYFRNNPSVLLWEAGNTGVTAAQMQQMVDLRREFDPHGGRIMGCRSLTDPVATAVREWFGTMLGGPYNAQVRNKAPLIETEDFRDEGARRFWDDYSRPYFGFKKGPNDTWNYNSETLARLQGSADELVRHPPTAGEADRRPEPARGSTASPAVTQPTDHDIPEEHTMPGLMGRISTLVRSGERR